MKPLKSIEYINKEFDKWWENNSSNHGAIRHNKDSIKSFYASKIEELLEKQAKAFGGCELCFGKGYFTEKTSITAYADFSGTDKKIELMRYNPCSCDRGKQFRQVIEELVKSLVPEKESGKAHTPSIHENAERRGLIRQFNKSKRI